MRAVADTLLLAAALALALPTTALADKADRLQPIQIEADSLRMDDSRKTAVYEGNVILTQGSLQMRADRIDVRQDDKGMASGEATGRPVTFRQKVEGRKQFIEAQANRIEYDAQREILRLVGSASLRQGEDEVRGGLIVYDIRAESYRAQGGVEGSSPGRVRAVIAPREAEPTTEPRPAPRP